MEKQGTRREKFGLFGPRALGRAVHAAADGPGLSKAEFMEKVRQSNEACQLGDFQTAVKLYGEALRADPQNCILYSNRSAAHLKLGQYQTALDDAVKARLLNPKWPKSHFMSILPFLLRKTCPPERSERKRFLRRRER
ncbi:hypothetical protein QQF64_001789, partial [Cirrhinus molitorella]